MPTRSFPPTPDESDDVFDPILSAEDDEDEPRLEIIVSERGTQWSDDDDEVSDEALVSSGIDLPGADRVARFIGALDRPTGTGGEIDLLTDLDREGLATFQAAWSSFPGRARVELARRLVVAGAERYDLQFTRIFFALLSDAEPAVRQFAVTGLADEQDPKVLDQFVRLVETDGSTDVRAAVATALSDYADLAAGGNDLGMDPDELRDLLETIVVDEDEPEQLRRAALESWAVFGSGGAEGFSSTVAEAIAEMYNTGDTASQASALIAMGRTLDRVWLPFVERDLASEDAEIRLAAVRAAGQLAETALVEPVTELTSDDDDEVRGAAVVALGQIGGPGAVRVLRGLAADPDRTDQDAINEAIEEASLAAEVL